MMEPIKFNPIFKQTLWGGNKIAGFKRLACDAIRVGESWEISGVKGSESVIINGPYKDKRLSDVVKEMRHNLLGVENYRRFGNEFPLLVKFIDASQDLSIQVHPDDNMARKYGLDHGKTEMWYMMGSDPKARTYCGLKKRLTPDEYRQKIENETICDAIAEYEVREDDCFFIPAGRIHCIGKGCFLTEIQQTSDTTYRIYDFKRKDKHGNYRDLHTRQAAECIDYKVESDYRTAYVPVKNQGVPLVNCEYFNTSVYDLDEPLMLDYSRLDSFIIFTGIKGKGVFVDNEGNRTILREGETMLVPATTKTFDVSGTVKFLETYI